MFLLATAGVGSRTHGTKAIIPQTSATALSSNTPLSSSLGPMPWKHRTAVFVPMSYATAYKRRGKTMRIIVVGLLIAVIPLQAFAAASKKPVATKQSMTPAPRKPDPCKQYGAGFVQVEGTSTCIRVGGSVGIGGGVSQ